jgi:hypothetical protein
MKPTLNSCRALLACGITGQFEAWNVGGNFARLTGDIVNVAKLDVKERPVRFVRYEPVATGVRVPQSRPDSPSASEDMGRLPGTGLRAPSTADLAAQ